MFKKPFVPDGTVLREQGRSQMSEWITTTCVVLVEGSLVALGLSLYKGFISSPRTLVAGVAGLMGVIVPVAYLVRAYFR